MQIKHYDLRYYQIRLYIVLLPLVTIGCLSIHQVSSDYSKKQLMGIIVGLVLMAVVSLIDYKRILEFSWLLYIGNLILLTLVLVPGIGVEVNSARRWINLGIQIQPSELSKIILVIFIARYLQVHEEDLNKPKVLLRLCFFIALPLVLVLQQPNLSTTIITFLVFATMVFLGGLGRKIVLWIIGMGLPSLIVGIWYIQQPGQKLLKDYQLQRVLGFLDPQKYSQTFYQQENAVTALGSGQLTGNLMGGNNISLTQTGFLPEAQTDFIFAIVGHEFGFIGTASVLILLMVLVVMCFHLGTKASDIQGQMICYGIASLIAFQSFLNMSVATALAPNTGVPLPFVSYGLSSLWSMFISMGILLNIGLQRNRYA